MQQLRIGKCSSGRFTAGIRSWKSFQRILHKKGAFVECPAAAAGRFQTSARAEVSPNPLRGCHRVTSCDQWGDPSHYGRPFADVSRGQLSDAFSKASHRLRTMQMMRAELTSWRPFRPWRWPLARAGFPGRPADDSANFERRGGVRANRPPWWRGRGARREAKRGRESVFCASSEKTRQSASKGRNLTWLTWIRRRRGVFSSRWPLDLRTERERETWEMGKGEIAFGRIFSLEFEGPQWKLVYCAICQQVEVSIMFCQREKWSRSFTSKMRKRRRVSLETTSFTTFWQVFSLTFAGLD